MLRRRLATLSQDPLYGTAMRLLVIEDNRNLVANLFAYFEARGHVLDAAPDGITGLHLALTKPYDALILDWMLPRMDGPEVLRKLRNEDGFHGRPLVRMRSEKAGRSRLSLRPYLPRRSPWTTT